MNQDESVIPENKEKFNYIEKYEPLNDYIKASQVKSNKQSNENDINLQLKDFDLKELNKYLSSIKVKPQEQQFEEECAFREKIKDQIFCGFNTLIYGYGSKQQLLEDIAQTIIIERNGYIIFQIKGFRPQASIKMSLIHLIDSLRQINQKKEKFSVENALQWLQTNIRSNQKLLFLIHSIDGKNLMTQQNQELISKISSMKNVQILASFDNYRYNFVGKLNNTLYINYNTFRPYQDEIQQCFDQQINKQNREDGLWYIIQSLNDNQNKILSVLAKLQQNYCEGVPFDQLYVRCVDEMILSFKDALKDNLKELLQSGIVEIKKEKYIINHSDKIIQQLASRDL